MAKRSYWEQIMLALIKAEKLPEPIQEYKFCEDRKWRADFLWVKEKVILEVNGAIWTFGRHTRGGRGYLNECEKTNTATLLGFKVLNVCPEHINSGQAITWLREALNLN